MLSERAKKLAWHHGRAKRERMAMIITLALTIFISFIPFLLSYFA